MADLLYASGEAWIKSVIDSGSGILTGADCIVVMELSEVVIKCPETVVSVFNSEHFFKTDNGLLESVSMGRLVVTSNGSTLNFPCDIDVDNDLLVIIFTAKSITYHAMLELCRLYEVSHCVIDKYYGLVVTENFINNDENYDNFSDSCLDNVS